MVAVREVAEGRVGGHEGGALAGGQAAGVVLVDALEGVHELTEPGLVGGGVVRVGLLQSGLDGVGGLDHAVGVEPEVRVGLVGVVVVVVGLVGGVVVMVSLVVVVRVLVVDDYEIGRASCRERV